MQTTRSSRGHIQYLNPKWVQRVFGRSQQFVEVPMFRVAFFEDEGVAEPCTIFLSLRLDEMENYCHGIVPLDSVSGRQVVEEALTPEEDKQIQEYCTLIAKTLIYASIPQFKPAKILGRKQYPSYGGKPEVKNRPQRPAFRVQYLPRVVQQIHRVGPHKHEFKGRRGHFHHYGVTEAGKKKFKNRAGTFDWFPPIAGPNGEIPKPIFRVRKPTLIEATA